MSDRIQQAYIALFGRPADPAGLNFWASASATLTDAELYAQLAKSPEYVASTQGATSSTLVTELYQNLFGRAPDAAGLAFWTQAMNNAGGNPAALAQVAAALSSAAVPGSADQQAIANKTVVATALTNTLATTDNANSIGPDVMGAAKSAMEKIGAGPLPSAAELAAAVGDASAAVAAATLSKADAVVQNLYVAMFGRPADPSGLAFWRVTLDNLGGDTSALGRSFASPTNAEFVATYGALSNEQFLAQVYKNLMGREPDAAGLQHWKSTLEGLVSQGKSGLDGFASVAAEIVQAVAGNPGSSDAATAANIASVAQSVTNALIQQAGPNADLSKITAETLAATKSLLDGITSDPASVTAAQAKVAAAAKAVLESAGVPVVNPPVLVPNTIVKTLGSVVDAGQKLDGTLLAGSGNPATGFATSTNETVGLQLALSARNTSPADLSNAVVPVTGDSNTASFTIAKPSSDTSDKKWGFAWSVASTQIDLKDLTKVYDITLILDTDASSGTASNITWKLDASGASWTTTSPLFAYNGSPVGQQITDGGISAQANQNIWNFNWDFLKSAVSNWGGSATDALVGNFKITLAATALAGTATSFSESIVLNVEDKKTVNVDKAVAEKEAGYLHAGTGNANTHFVTQASTANDLELGLSVRHAGNAPVRAGEVLVATEQNGITTFNADSNVRAQDIRIAYSLSGKIDAEHDVIKITSSDFTTANLDLRDKVYGITQKALNDAAVSADTTYAWVLQKAAGGEALSIWNFVASTQGVETVLTSITDDAGIAGSVSQNIQPFLALFKSEQVGKGGLMDIDLTLSAYGRADKDAGGINDALGAALPTAYLENKIVIAGVPVWDLAPPA